MYNIYLIRHKDPIRFPKCYVGKTTKTIPARYTGHTCKSLEIVLLEVVEDKYDAEDAELFHINNLPNTVNILLKGSIEWWIYDPKLEQFQRDYYKKIREDWKKKCRERDKKKSLSELPTN